MEHIVECYYYNDGYCEMHSNECDENPTCNGYIGEEVDEKNE